MLKQIADGVFAHESNWVQSNAVVVQGSAGVLLIDPGIHASEMACIARDIASLGQPVVAGFSTHPHWDHLIWDEAFGDVPRYSTALCASTAETRLSVGIDRRRLGVPEDVSLDLVGNLVGVPDGADHIPWDGPSILLIEHRAHAPGHAALFVEDSGVLIGGDMLSDVLIPMLDLTGAVNPIEDYLAALQSIERVADEVQVLIPGHGSIAAAGEVHARIGRDRAYVEALRDGIDPSDSRIGASARPGWEWVAGVHDRQAGAIGQRAGREAPGS